MLPWQPFFAFYIWGAHWRHLKNTTEPSMCGGVAALCQITLTTCFILPSLQILWTLKFQNKQDWLTETARPMRLTYTPWAIKTEPTYFCLWLREKSTHFNTVFTLRFSDEQYTWRYKIHPPRLISVATLPCESRNSENVILQWDITKENCIKSIVYASSKWICRW